MATVPLDATGWTIGRNPLLPCVVAPEVPGFIVVLMGSICLGIGPERIHADLVCDKLVFHFIHVADLVVAALGRNAVRNV